MVYGRCLLGLYQTKAISMSTSLTVFCILDSEDMLTENGFASLIKTNDKTREKDRKRRKDLKALMIYITVL